MEFSMNDEFGRLLSCLIWFWNVRQDLGIGPMQFWKTTLYFDLVYISGHFNCKIWLGLLLSQLINGASHLIEDIGTKSWLALGGGGLYGRTDWLEMKKIDVYYVVENQWWWRAQYENLSEFSERRTEVSFHAWFYITFKIQRRRLLRFWRWVH